MAAETSASIRWTTFALLAITATATALAATAGVPRPWDIGLCLLSTASAALVGCLVARPADTKQVPPRLVLVVLVLLGVAPFLVEPWRREWLGEGHALELQMMFALQNVGLGLAAFSAWSLCLHLACFTSLFLMLFAATMSDQVAVLCLLGLYSAIGSVWLMLVHWTSLCHLLPAAPNRVALVVHSGRERLPWLSALVVVALIGATVGLVAAGPQRTATVLAEWFPTSGGTGAHDPFARGGVNDGDTEVRGDKPRSTGMTQTDQFLESPLPTLYDAISDLYGEPYAPKDRERAIGLDPLTKLNEGRKPPADNLRPDRDFPVLRKSPREPREPSARAARAIFEVQGRTPLHVRVTAFDAFDGARWYEAPLRPWIRPLDKERDSCWMTLRQFAPPEIFAEASEPHQFKLTRPSGSLLPTPPHLLRLRVGRVDRADFFCWGQDQILRLAQRKTPSGIVVETQSRCVEPRSLTCGMLASAARGPRECVAVPELDPAVSALAQRWGAEAERGWAQVAAVVAHLRSDYALDPAAVVPVPDADPLAHFLLHARRGPDYQFATAAAVLLRLLGYPTRLVTGFYVAPEHYDSDNEHTPVVQEDLHFWPEVLLSSGDWLVVEPTPGYQVLGPRASWSERLEKAVTAVLTWLSEHACALSALLALAGAVWLAREALLDMALSTLWRLCPGSSWQERVGRAAWLLEWRGRRARQARRAAQTFPAWLRSMQQTHSLPRGSIDRLTVMAEWAAYGPDSSPPWNANDVRRVCRHAVTSWTLRRLRGASHRTKEKTCPLTCP